LRPTGTSQREEPKVVDTGPLPVFLPAFGVGVCDLQVLRDVVGQRMSLEARLRPPWNDDVKEKHT